MRLLLTSACMALLPALALAQEVPTPDQLQANVSSKIGSFWSASKFSIVAKKLSQDPLKPIYTIRFELDAMNPAPLYTPNGSKLGPAQILVMTVPAKTERKFYGTEQLAYTAGKWTGPTDIENPADKLGKPLDFYTVPTLVLGSDQYKQAVAQQAAYSLDQRKAQFQKQLDALQQAETAKLDGLQNAFAARLKATADATSAQLKTQQSQVATLRTSDAAEIADIEKTFEAGLQKVNADFAGRLKQQQADLTGELSAELTKSQQALADEQQKVEAARAALIAQQQDALAKLKLGLQSTQDAVAAKIKLAQATVDAQNKLITLQKQVLANNVTLVSLKSKLAERDQTQLASFEGTWGGTLQCDKKAGNPYGVYATQMQLVLKKQVGGMLTGQLIPTSGDNGYGHGHGYMQMNAAIPASLQIMNPNDPGGPKVTITSSGKSDTDAHFLNFDAQLDASGKLKGSVIHVDPADCSVIFSR